MKTYKKTFLVFIIAIIALTIVIFNNTMGMIDRLFIPEYNSLALFSLLGMIIPSTWYIVYNWRG